MWSLLVGTAASVALACSSADADLPRVVLIGDSITHGEVSGPPGPSFAEVLRRDFASEARVEVAACPGSNTRSWTYPGSVGHCSFSGAFEELAAPLLPARVAVVMLGTNDAVGPSFHEPVPPLEYEERLTEIVHRLRAGGTQVVVLVTPPPLGAKSVVRRPAHREKVAGRMEEYREIIQRVCAREATCGPDLLARIDPVLHFDGAVHPNAAGHAEIAAALAPTLRSALAGGAPDPPPALEKPGAAPGEEPEP